MKMSALDKKREELRVLEILMNGVCADIDVLEKEEVEDVQNRDPTGKKFFVSLLQIRDQGP